MTRLGPTYKAITEPGGKVRIVERENPKLNTSAKIARKKSKKQKPVRRTV